ncbi:transmembrane protein 132A isoform X1 [Salmo salar]|uniref:Transmembrane protein 132A isoform X1 n=2 Tax=Salmo salar TaxID=8030 RepID=A0A1S3RG77_SALSA|nr:transmembrane protein 132A-like isoform X1 [Salmo salar]
MNDSFWCMLNVSLLQDAFFCMRVNLKHHDTFSTPQSSKGAMTLLGLCGFLGSFRGAVMGEHSCPSALWGREGVKVLALYSLLAVVHTSHAQPPLPLSLPAKIVVPPPWHALPLLQADLGSLFSNSSPFAFSQSLLMVPPAGEASKAGVRASFGPYSVSQLVSGPILPLSPPLSASLLSKHVERERDEGGKERYRVRVLFHVRGDASRGSCITLHAFKETEEQKASCITQPPLGLCVVTLALPKDWFEVDQTSQPYLGPSQHARHTHRHRTRNRGRRHEGVVVGGADGIPFPGALRYSPAHTGDRIQLYYSLFGIASNIKLAPPRCVEDKLPQSQRQLIYIGAVTLRKYNKGREANRTKEEIDCCNGQEEEELRLDSNVLIRYRRGPVRTGQPIGISVNLKANFNAEFVVIRLKVKKGLLSLVAQRSLNSDLWVVNLEKTQGSKHDVISIICHKLAGHMDSDSPAALQQVACLSVDGLRRSFGVAMTVSASWWVEYSGRNNPPPPHGGVVSSFSFTDREIVGISPITESGMIINTAILTSEPVSLPVIVLAVGHDGKVSDITAAVKCQSSNDDIIKVSSDCSTLFVDGSESGVGSTCVGVEFLLGTLSGSLCLSVWAPVVPLRVSLSDNELSAIDGWNHYTENGCSPVYQRSTVQVLTQFSAQGGQGQLNYLLGSSDWFVDATELVRNWLRVENPRVAVLDKQSNLIGLHPGKTSVHVISSQWDGVLGSCDVIVTSEPVTPGDLSVQVVGGLGMSINASPAHPAVVTATVTAYNILYNHEQEASISVWLQFSDDSATLLSAFSRGTFALRLSSLAETVVAVTPGPSLRIVAQGEGGGPLLKAELLVPTCKPMANSVDGDLANPKEGSGTRRLAKGSGWIRVNLDSDLRPMGSEEANLELLNISDMLMESSDRDVQYRNFPDNDIIIGNVTAVSGDDYYDKAGDGMIARNDLERAVLTPNHEESAVYFSPGVEREREEKLEDKELEVGVGAVLSLLCLSALLFLVNCLPCALRERRKRKDMNVEGVEGVVEEEWEEGEEEVKEEAEAKEVAEKNEKITSYPRVISLHETTTEENEGQSDQSMDH